MTNRILLMLGMTAATAVATAAEQDGGIGWLNLEAHGFVSFGYLETERNNWLGPTTGGTGEFWETAANIIARPMDRLRIGAQVFARDLVKYDNGRVDLDWAYADYRMADEFGIQVGRVKLPLALYNEALDIDAARSSVFLAPSVYALRARDLFISIDGAKVYGSIDLGGVGSFDYSGFAGAKPIDEDGGFATYMAETGLGPVIDDISTGWAAGGMLQWNTPLDGLAVRVSAGNLHDFTVDGSDPGNFTTHTQVGNYLEWWFSVLYEMDELTLAAEYTRVHGRGETVIDPGGVVPLVDNSDGAYVSATWHATRWMDIYVAVEGAWDDAYDRDLLYAYTGVLACNVMPLPSWSVKAELRGVHGTYGINAVDNPAGIDDRWGVVALKTTVDF